MVYVHAGQQVIADYARGAAAAAPSFRYVYGSDVDEPLLRHAGTGTTLPTSGTAALYYHRNQQYSIVGLSDAAGNLVERYAYTAYGELTILAPDRTVRTTSSFQNRYTYTGREWDPTLRLHYFRARWLEPKAGRFIGRDPLGYVDGMGLYGAYFTVRGVDPYGLLLSPFQDPQEPQFNRDDIRNWLPDDSYAKRSILEIDRIRGLDAGNQILELPNAAYQGAWLFFTSGTVISAAYRKARCDLNSIRYDEGRSPLEQGSAKILRFTLASEVTEIVVQGANTVGQAGPISPLASASPTLQGILQSRAVHKISQATAGYLVADDAIKGRFDSDRIAKFGFTLLPETMWWASRINTNGKVTVTSWATPG
ncbi:MAG: RHS repeat-associated core domain-containing protein, partial [Planctomycetota bacterium]